MTSVDLMKTVKSYTGNRAKSGAKGLALIYETMAHAFEHGDWTSLAWLMGKMEEKEARVVRRIVGACSTGIKAERDAKQPSGLMLHGFKKSEDGTRRAMPSNNFGLLAELVADKKDFNSKAVADALFPSNKVEKAWDLKEAIAVYERAIDKIIDHGFDLSDVLRAFNEARSNVTEAEQARDARKGK